MGKFNEELVKAGVMLAGGEGLHPSSKGKRVVFSRGKKTVVDGPFAETKELIAGFWLWQVKSMEEALEWVRRCPDPMPGEESVIEIRSVYEAEELGEGPSCGHRKSGSARRSSASGSPERRRYSHGIESARDAKEAEEAARFYASVFPDSRVDRVTPLLRTRVCPRSS